MWKIFAIKDQFIDDARTTKKAATRNESVEWTKFTIIIDSTQPVFVIAVAGELKKAHIRQQEKEYSATTTSTTKLFPYWTECYREEKWSVLWNFNIRIRRFYLKW